MSTIYGDFWNNPRYRILVRRKLLVTGYVGKYWERASFYYTNLQINSSRTRLKTRQTKAKFGGEYNLSKIPITWPRVLAINKSLRTLTRDGFWFRVFEHDNRF